jgi:hypothetical protein
MRAFTLLAGHKRTLRDSHSYCEPSGQPHDCSRFLKHSGDFSQSGEGFGFVAAPRGAFGQEAVDGDRPRVVGKSPAMLWLALLAFPSSRSRHAVSASQEPALLKPPSAATQTSAPDSEVSPPRESGAARFSAIAQSLQRQRVDFTTDRLYPDLRLKKGGGLAVENAGEEFCDLINEQVCHLKYERVSVPDAKLGGYDLPLVKSSIDRAMHKFQGMLTPGARAVWKERNPPAASGVYVLDATLSTSTQVVIPPTLSLGAPRHDDAEASAHRRRSREAFSSLPALRITSL